MKAFSTKVAIAIFILTLLGCATSAKQPPLIKEVPAQNYERIIYLRTESPTSIYKTLGLIYILPGKKITTTYPYQWDLKSETQLTPEEKLNFPSMKIMELKNQKGEVQGYIRVLGPVVVTTFEKDDGLVVQLDHTKNLGELPLPSIPNVPGGPASPRT